MRRSAARARVRAGRRRAARWPSRADYGAHPDFRTEWWYVTGWLQTPTASRSASRSPSSAAAPARPRQPERVRAEAADHRAMPRCPTRRWASWLHDQSSAREGFGLAYAKTATPTCKLDDWRMRARRRRPLHASASNARELHARPALAPTPAADAAGRRRLFAQRAAAGAGQLLLQRAAAEGDGSVSRAGAGRQRSTGTAWLDHEWSSQVLDPNARRLGLDRRQPGRRLGA